MRTRVSYDQRLNMPTDAFAVFLSFLLSSPVLGEQALHSYVVSEDDGKTLDLKQGKPRESQHFPPVYAEARMSGNYLETGWVGLLVGSQEYHEPTRKNKCIICCGSESRIPRNFDLLIQTI